MENLTVDTYHVEWSFGGKGVARCNLLRVAAISIAIHDAA